MANKEELVNYLADHFRSISDDIPEKWAQHSIDSNFGEFELTTESVHPTLLDDENYLEHLRQLSSRFLDYIDQGDSDGLWVSMAEVQVKPTGLMVFFWFSVEMAGKNDSTFAQLKAGIVAGRAYLAMCAINGSQAYGIFNQFLYQKVLDIHRLALRHLLRSGQPVARSTGGRGGSKATGRGRGAGKSGARGKNTTTIDRDNDETVEALILTRSEEGDLQEALHDSLDALYVFLGKVSLSAFPEYAILTANFVRDVLVIDLAKCEAAKEIERFMEFSPIRLFSAKSFALSHRLIHKRHNGVALVLSRIIMPRLLYWTFDNGILSSTSAIPSSYGHQKDLAVNFLRNRIKKKIKEEFDTILLVLQNVCQKCADRAEYRIKVAVSIVEVLSLLPRSYAHKFARFLYLFGHNVKNSMRVFAVDVVMRMLAEFELMEDEPEPEKLTEIAMDEVEKSNEQDESNETESDDEEEEEPSSRTKKNEPATPPEFKKGTMEALLAVVLDACTDRAPTVRTRGLINLATLLGNRDLRDKLMVLAEKTAKGTDISQNQPVATDAGEVTETDDEANVSLRGEERRSVEDARARITDHPLLNIIIQRCYDEKSGVRKAALSTLQAIYASLDREIYRTRAMDAFKMRARDVGLSVRKQAAESMTALLVTVAGNGIEDPILEIAWLHTVLPMIIDREGSVQTLVARQITEIMATSIVNDTEAAPTAWRLLATVEKEADNRRLLLRAFTHSEARISDRIVRVLQQKVDEPDKTDTAWMLLADLSTSTHFQVNTDRARAMWFTIAADSESSQKRKVTYVAKVIASGVKNMKVEMAREELASDMGERLFELSVDVSNISAVYYAMAKLLDAIGDEATGAQRLAEYNGKFIERWYKHLHALLFEQRTSIQGADHNEIDTENRLIRAVSLLGEVLQYSPTMITNEIFKILQILIASDAIQFHMTQLAASRPATGIEIHGESARSPVTGTRDEHATTMGRGGTEGWMQVSLSQMPLVSTPLLTRAVRAHSVIALGKLCLQDESLAKKCIPVFAQQLKVNEDHFIRNNIVVVVCDLCTRYTLLVDRYSAILAACLKDRSTLVRQQTLMLLTNLIKEQFLKWEGQIMYRFVSTVFDESPKIRQFAEFCLLDVLLVQFEGMFFNHFLECVFYFNAVVHASWSAASQARGEDAINANELAAKCGLSEDHHANERLRLYKFMLRTMKDDQKFTISARVSNEIYGAVVEGTLDFANENVKALLRDACKIMTSKEIKLSLSIGQRDPAAEDDESEAPQIIQEHAHKVITAAYRQATIDLIMPNVISLKCFLQRQRSPLLRECMEMIRELCKDHKENLDAFLANDRQLQAEIAYDLKRLADKEQREANRKRMKKEAAAKQGDGNQPQPAAQDPPMEVDVTQNEEDSTHFIDT